MQSGKRKRDAGYPRITYHASGRTFDRLFKEESLKEMKEVARTKLGIPSNAVIILEQIRDGKPIDLEDDDDFDAFYSVAHSTSFANVRVSIDTSKDQVLPATVVSAPAQSVSKVEHPDQTPKTNPHQNPTSQSHPEPSTEANRDHPEERPGINHSGIRYRKVSFSSVVSGDASDSGAPRQKKKRKTNIDDTSSTGHVVSNELLLASTSSVSNEPSPDIEASSSAVLPPPNAASTPVIKVVKKKKHKEKEQGSEIPPLTPPKKETGRQKKGKKREISEPGKTSFPEELAGVISRTSQTDQETMATISEPRQSEKQEKRKTKKPRLQAESMSSAQQNADLIKGISKINDSKPQEMGSVSKGSVTPKTKAHAKKPTKNNQIPALGGAQAAALQAALSRFLAAKRASLNIPAAHPANATSIVSMDMNLQGLQSSNDPRSSNDVSIPSMTITEPPTAETSIAESQNSIRKDVDLALTSDPSSPVVKNDSDRPPIQRTNKSDNGRESSASDDDGRVAMSSISPLLHGTSLYAKMDLDAIVRGPTVSISAANIAFSETSEEEDGQDLEEDEDDVKQNARHIRSRLAGSSSEEEDSDDGSNANHNDVDDPPRSMASPLLDTSTERFSFRGAGCFDEAHKMDTTGDAAFRDAMTADSAILEVTDLTSTSAESGVCMVPSSISRPQSPVTPTSASAPTGTGTPALPTQIIEESLEARNSDQAIDGHPAPAEPGQMKREARGSKGKTMGLATPESGKGKREANSNQSDSIARRTRKASRLHTLSSLVPPSLPNVPGRQSRTIKRSNTFQAKATSDETASKLREPGAATGWTVLPASSPVLEGESMLVDELQSSSPGSRVGEEGVKGAVNGHGRKQDPLFLHSASQPSFPYSQWTGGESQRTEHDSIVNDSEVEMPGEAMQRPEKSKGGDMYRGLTEIASKGKIFTPPTRAKLGPENKLRDMYGRWMRKEEEASESESESDSEGEVSHIPEGRRAG